MRSPSVVCIGVATVDAIVSVERLPASDERVPAADGRLAGGGVAATAAVALARLGVPVAFVGRVADDTAGRWIRDDLAAAGVDVTGLRRVTGTSPVSAVLVERASGSRALVPFAGSAGPIELDDADLDRCRAAAWVHVDHVGSVVLEQLARTRISTPVSLDGGVPVDGLALGGVALYAPTEAALLARYPDSTLDAGMQAALAEGPACVVVTRGAAGSVAIARDASGAVVRHAAAAFEVPGGAVSTLGAGDVFHGALLASLVDGDALDAALTRANAVAALACRALDGRSAIPDRAVLEAFIAHRSPEGGHVGA
jgi:sulfofructose kinase